MLHGGTVPDLYPCPVNMAPNLYQITAKTQAQEFWVATARGNTSEETPKAKNIAFLYLPMRNTLLF